MKHDIARILQDFDSEKISSSQAIDAIMALTKPDPTSDARWNEGCDFAMTQLCMVLGVDPRMVNWDAATETVDGDVQAVIGNIFLVKFGENWADHLR